MRPLIQVAVSLFACSAAFAFPVNAPKGTRVGAGCAGPVKTLVPHVRTCLIKGAKKSRIWCPNGKAFDLDEALGPRPLARSLCELTQIAD